MKCLGYKSWITDAALGGLSPSHQAELDAHLAGCSGCRAAVQQEQSAFAVLNQGLSKLIAEDPSPAFVPAVRARIASEARPSSVPLFMRAPVLAGAALVCAALAVAVVYWPQKQPTETPTASSLPAPSLQAPAGPKIEAANSPQSFQPPRVPNRPPTQHSPSEAEFFSQVLVPRDQWKAIFDLQKATRARPLEASRAAPVESFSNAVPIVVSEITVPPIEVQPLERPSDPAKGSSK